MSKSGMCRGDAMFTSREKLQEIQRSLNECWRHADKYCSALPFDNMDRRKAEEDLARAKEILAEITGMLT
jgi:hypothetical protein